MTMNPDSTGPEGLIRNYLLWLEGPEKLLDQAEIEKAQQAVDHALDPIDKLKAHAELKRVKEIDDDAVKAGFVTHAKAWAEDQGIPIGAFKELNVPDDVLREAGFDVPAKRRQRRDPANASGEGQQRAKAVPVEEIKAYILQQEDPFLLADLMSGIGGSPATVRKAVDELIKTEQVEKLGPVPEWHGAGRAPIHYKTSPAG
jgi:hypothetical protein